METKLIATTPYISLKQRGNWAFASRSKGRGAVGIIAITNDNKVVLVEQYRIPHEKFAVELPAGLLGDEIEGETPLEAAHKELLEETGYKAGTMEPFGNPVCSSAGLSDETLQLFVATNLEKVHNGGGVGSEKIVVHEVPLSNYYEWVFSPQQATKIIDTKVIAIPGILAALHQAKDQNSEFLKQVLKVAVMTAGGELEINPKFVEEAYEDKGRLLIGDGKVVILST